jgi:glycosyltransferase involved in cell wall biosynthesis
LSSVSVIVPARDAEETLPWVLAGLAEQDYSGQWEVIVVDNGSSDATGSLARDSSVVSRVVRIDGLGPADSRNAGVAASASGWLAFLDSDCRPTRSWLSAGVQGLEQAELAQGKTVPDPGAELGPFDRTLSVGRFTGLFESANMFVRRDTFERVGGFQHWLGGGKGNRRPFGEDVAFGWRAQRLGARITFSPEALVYHAVFKRGLASYAAERLRLRFFPELVGQVPELREHFFYRRWFLSRRTAAFDLALVGCAGATVRRTPAALLAVLPYLSIERARWQGFGPRSAAMIALVDLTADAVGLTALLAGSIRSGSPVL